MNDLINISFDNNPPDTAVLLVSRNYGETTIVLKEFTGNQAIVLYEYLTR